MASRVETIKFTDFTDRIPAADWDTFWKAAHNRKAGRYSLVHFISGWEPRAGENPKNYTSFYNVTRSLEAHVKGIEFTLNSGKDHYDPTTGLVPLGAGADMDTLADAVRRFQNGEGFRDFSNAAATPNQTGSSASTPSGGTSVTPGSAAVKSEPLPVDPETVEAVSQMLANVASAPVHNTGRQFLSWVWEQTPESIREQRTADIVRGVLESAESTVKRGLIRKLMDSLNGSFTIVDGNGNAVDLYAALNTVLPESERTASTEQVATIVGNTYRFDPNAPMFRNWSTDLDNRSRLIARVVGKDRSGGNPAPEYVASAAADLAEEALQGIAAGLKAAQVAYEKHIAARMQSAPPPPQTEALSLIPWENLSETVQDMIGNDSVWGMLTPENQRQWLINRSVTPVEGKYRSGDERRGMEEAARAAAETPAPAPETDPESETETPAPAAEVKSANTRTRR